MVVAYAPTEVSKILTKVEFYKELNASHNQMSRGDERILIGDFNAQVGNDNDIWKGVIGKQSLHAKESGNRKRLLDFCCLNEYVVC